MTTEELKNMVDGGAVYASNADAAHTMDNLDDAELIKERIDNCGFREMEIDTDEYADAATKLDLPENTTARIFVSGEFMFAPDALR